MFALIWLPYYSSDNTVERQHANIPRFYINKVHLRNNYSPDIE